MTPRERAELVDKIRMALADPKAPWYGSDLVPWVADYMEDRDQAIEAAVVAEQERFTKTLITYNGTNLDYQTISEIIDRIHNP